MPFERLLLLWDELDELTGAIRHSYLHLAHSLSGLRLDVVEWASAWLGTSTVASAAALPEASPEG